MSDVLSPLVVDTLARTLAHFVWQGAAIALVMLAGFRAFRSSASARYLVGVGGLAAMLAAPIATFIILMTGPPTAVEPISTSVAAGVRDAAIGAAPSATPATGASAARQIDWLMVVVLAWMAGAAGFTLRLAGGWIVARRYATRAVQPASEHLVMLAHQLAERMNIRRAVAIVQSSAVSVPVMVGWLKPTIVLPVAALAGLSPAQVEALIAHELAHVCRHDYLVNLLQSTVEALLFYHPAVWWLSRRVRAERELCCDDLAVSVCDRLVYATALTDLVTIASPRVALAATDGDLLGRVRRILGRGEGSAGRASVTPLIAATVVAAFVIPAALAYATPPQHPQNPHPTTRPHTPGPHAAVPPAIHDALHPQGSPTPKPSPSPTASPKPATSEAQALEELVKRHHELSQKLHEQEVLKEKFADVAKKVEEMRNLRQKEHVAELEKMVRAVEHFKVEAELNALAHAQSQSAAGRDLAALMEKLRQTERDLERAKTLHEKGLMSASQLRDLELAAVELKKQIEAMPKLMHATATELAAHNERAAAEAQLARAAHELERSKMLVDKGLMSKKQLDEQQDRVAELKRQAERHQAEVAEHANTDLKVLSPSMQLQAGDLLEIVISGEPPLQPYRVSQEGTIRMLFVGSIRVAGLTTSQIKDAIGKRLGELKLGTADRVTVTARRVGK